MMEPVKRGSLQHIKTAGRRVVTRLGDSESHREQWQMITFVLVMCSFLYWGDRLIFSWQNSVITDAITDALRYAVPLIVYSLIVLTIGLVLSWRRMSEMGEIKVVSMDETGFVIGNRRFESSLTEKISWSNVDMVEVIKEPHAQDKEGNEGSVIYFTTRDVRVYKLRWENAFAWVDAESFFIHLKTQTPQPEIYFSADEPAIEKDDTRYTNLWLQYFSSPGTRQRKGVLPNGTILNDRYHVLRKVGGGGQGTVYLASVKKKDIPDGFGEPGYSDRGSAYSGSARALDYQDDAYQSGSIARQVDEGAVLHSAGPGRETEAGPFATEFGADLAAFNADYIQTQPSTSYFARPARDEDEQFIVLKEYILPVHRGAMLEEKHYGMLNSEAAILGRIKHPNIVKMLDCFVEDHRGYLVLEYVNGASLRDFVQKSGPLSEAHVREVAITVCDILTYLHNFRPPIVHRDLTPDNLLVEQDGTIKLIDFTVAHQLESQRTATVVGKQAYIPPEQFRGAPGPESDVYALGCTMHFLLTGQDPEPMQPSHPKDIIPSISDRMNDIVATATAFDTTARFGYASQLRSALEDQI